MVLAVDSRSCFALYFPWLKNILYCCCRFSILYATRLVSSTAHARIFKKYFEKSWVWCTIPWQLILISTKWKMFWKGRETLHHSSVPTQVRIKRHHSCQRRRNQGNQERKLLDKKECLFSKLNGICTTQGIPSISHFIFKSFQCRKCWCECKIHCYYEQFYTQQPLCENIRFQIYSKEDYFGDLSSTFIDLHVVVKKFDNKVSSLTYGISYENCVLHNLFRQISVYINGTLVSTSNNLSNYTSYIQFCWWH